MLVLLLMLSLVGCATPSSPPTDGPDRFEQAYYRMYGHAVPYEQWQPFVGPSALRGLDVPIQSLPDPSWMLYPYPPPYYVPYGYESYRHRHDAY